MPSVEWKDARVLVTGGAGFIGSHLVEKVVEMGSQVVVADNLSRGKKENLKSVEKDVDLRITDLTKIENCLESTREVSCVFHLAASVGGIHYITKENVEGCAPSLLMNTNMLEAARRNDVRRFLFASSACVYRTRGEGMNKFKEEDAYPANPPTTYGWAKITGEVLCKAYYEDYGIKCSASRIFNVYGERENLDPKWSHVIPSLIRKAVLYPREGFRVFGDGSQERAFLYAGDCVEGLIRTMEEVENAEPLNLGSEEVVSIKQVAQKVVERSGKDISPEFDRSGPRGVNRYCADTTRMKRTLRWVPGTPLDEGLRRMFSWAEKKIAGGE